METTKEMQKRHQEELNNFEGLFFAFSKKQFEEGKEKIGVKDNGELISIGSGGFLPRNRLQAFEDMFKRQKEEKKQHREQKEVIEIKFVGIDSWSRPIFRTTKKPFKYYGSVNALFNDEATEKEVLEQVDEESLCYFGNSFGCEPLGSFAGNIKIITD